MLSPREIAQINEELERLEMLREGCSHSGVRNRIDAWIKLAKKKL